MRKLLLGVIIGVIVTMILMPSQKDTRVIITADHLSEDTYPDCSKIYSNPEQDIAVYYKDNYIPDKPLIGTVVKIEGAECLGMVVEAKDHYIVVRVKDVSSITYGLSGTAVSSIFGRKLGYITEAVGGNKLKAVLY